MIISISKGVSSLAIPVASAVIMLVALFSRRLVTASKRTCLENERDIADANARETRDRLELAEKIAHVGHWRYTPLGQNLEWSDEIYRIFGLTSAGCHPTIETMLQFICPNDQPAIRQNLDNAIRNAQSFEIVSKIRRLDGSIRHVIGRGEPQSHGGKIISIFGVFVDITDQKRIEDDLKAINLAGELANRALEELAMQDSVTGLPNRRLFDTTFATEFKRAARDKLTLGLVMIDLDHFKGFNDHYGHPAGDDCLRRVAEAIAGVPQRPADLVARYGGEEMVVLLPNTSRAGSLAVSELILQAVRDLRLPHATNQEGMVTISCGVAMFNPAADPQIPNMLLQRADKALYAAKHAGRNRACMDETKFAHTQ